MNNLLFDPSTLFVFFNNIFYIIFVIFYNEKHINFKTYIERIVFSQYASLFKSNYY